MSSSEDRQKTKLRIKAEAAAARLQEKRVALERKAQADAQADTAAKISQWQSIIMAASEGNDGNVNEGSLFNPKKANITDKKNQSKVSSKTHSLNKDILKLCTRGIPPNMRGTIWPLLIGTNIQITPEEFSILSEKADRLRVSSGLGTAFVSSSRATNGGTGIGGSTISSPTTSLSLISPEDE